MRKLLRCSSISDLVMYFSTLPSSSISAPQYFTHSYTTKEGALLALSIFFVLRQTGVKNWCHYLKFLRNIGKRLIKCPTLMNVRTMPIR